MRRFLRFGKWLALGIGMLIFLLALLYLEEDWRGARDWAAYQKELAAKGEVLDLRQLSPPGRPEDDLSKVPIFAEIYAQYAQADVDYSKLRIWRIDLYLRAEKVHPKTASYQEGKAIDLIPWQKFYRSLPQAVLTASAATPARDVLQALGTLDPEMGEVENAVNNPAAYWPIDYDRPFQFPLEGVTSMIQVAKVLSLQGVARLENHEPDEAEKDYGFSCEINRALGEKPVLVNYLVMLGVCAIDDAILWEGIHRHAWNAEQLQLMDSELGSTDLLAMAAKSLRMERANALACIAEMERRSARERRLVPGFNNPAVESFYQFRSRGIWDRVRFALTRLIQKQIDGIQVEEGTLRLQPPLARSNLLFFFTPLTQMTGPRFDKFLTKAAQAETHRRLARMACRLEEFYLDHHQYPEGLEELGGLPSHLNQEVLSAQPFHYGRKGDSYFLYSTGLDGIDHGGVRQGPRLENGVMNVKADYDWTWAGP